MHGFGLTHRKWTQSPSNRCAYPEAEIKPISFNINARSPLSYILEQILSPFSLLKVKVKKEIKQSEIKTEGVRS